METIFNNSEGSTKTSQNELDLTENKDRIYTETKIRFATFFGGPLAGAYLMARNFKIFQKPNRSLHAMIIGIVITLLLFACALTIPGVGRLPNYILPVIFAWIAYYLAQHYQGIAIREHLDSGGAAFGWGRTILVSLGIAILTIAIPVTAFVIYSFATDNTTSKTYGRMQHDISFDRNNISESEVDKIATELTKATFFDDEKKKSVDVTKNGSTYDISIYCNESIKQNREALQWFIDLRTAMQNAFPDNHIVFELVVGTPDNVVKRLE